MSLLKLPLPILLLLESALNRQIRRDSALFAQWQTLADRRITFDLRDPNLSLALCVTPQGVLLLREIEGMPSATIHASFLGLIRAQQSASPLDALFAGDVQIDGDQALAERILRLLLTMDTDFFAVLAEKIGVAPAGWLGLRWQERRTERSVWRETRSLELKDFLVFERSALPTSQAAQEWGDAVDSLRDRTDQLLARVAHLEALGAP